MPCGAESWKEPNPSFCCPLQVFFVNLSSHVGHPLSRGAAAFVLQSLHVVQSVSKKKILLVPMVGVVPLDQTLRVSITKGALKQQSRQKDAQLADKSTTAQAEQGDSTTAATAAAQARQLHQQLQQPIGNEKH